MVPISSRRYSKYKNKLKDMLKTIENFKEHWPGHLEMVYTDAEIEEWLEIKLSLAMCIDYAADHMVAQGLGYVEE